MYVNHPKTEILDAQVLERKRIDSEQQPRLLNELPNSVLT